MYVTYEQMPMNSRVWMYQANRALTPDEVAAMRLKLYEFCEQWNAHGAGLQSSFSIMYDRFIALLVNEEQAKASGCSIDSSVHIIKELGEQFNIDFFDRLTITYLDENGKLADAKGPNFKEVLKSQSDPESTIVFNNMVGSKRELETDWEVPVINSWQQKYL